MAKAREIVREFEGVALRVRPWRGRMWVEARNLGEVLGCKDPSDVVEMVRGRAEEFVDGIDVLRLAGEDLAAWKAATKIDDPGSNGVVDRVNGLTLLSELAARTVAMLARTPRARGVRRWLATVWAEIDRTGGYAPSAHAARIEEPAVVAEVVETDLGRTLRDAIRAEVAGAFAEQQAEFAALRQEVRVLRGQQENGAHLLLASARASVRLAKAVEAHAQGCFAFGEEQATQRPAPEPPATHAAPKPDPWVAIVERWLAARPEGRPWFVLEEILRGPLGLNTYRRADQNRLGAVLRGLEYRSSRACLDAQGMSALRAAGVALSSVRAYVWTKVAP